MTTDSKLLSGLFDSYRPPSAVYDEIHTPQGAPRACWREFLAAAGHLSPEQIGRRNAEANRIVRENGVTFNAFGDESEAQRPWHVDVFPLIIAQSEWNRIAAGLRQRARLLELILRDLYGPQELIRSRTLPPAAVFAHPGFIRAFHGLFELSAHPLTVYSSELARSSDGRWFVMADRADAPGGAGYALENRIVVARAIPSIMHRCRIQRLAPFFLRLQQALAELSPRKSDNPRIVLLSGGPSRPGYFEDVYLARYLGYTLVEGGDLAVRDNRVYLKTLDGLIQVDVIFARGPEGEIDPLELGGGAPHGVPGLLEAIRQRNVMLANLPGCGLVESPVFMAFLPQLCRQLLGEDLMLPSIATWWCGDPQSYASIRKRLSSLVIKPAFRASGSEEFIGSQLSQDELRKLTAEIDRQPHQFVAQEHIQRSAAPVWKDGSLSSGHVAIRTFQVTDGSGTHLMPGGLIRVAPNTDPMELSIAAGEGSKDLWVPADRHQETISLLKPPGSPVTLRRNTALFPSRVADNLFWLGRFLDRADILARLVRSLTDRLSSESEEELPELTALIRTAALQGQIDGRYAISELSGELPALEDEIGALVFDPTEAQSLGTALHEVQRLGSLVRDWLSMDTWLKIRNTCESVRGRATPHDLAEVLTALDRLIADVAAVSGLIGDGMIRGPAWRFLDTGRRIERGRLTAQILRGMLLEGRQPDRETCRAILELFDCRMTYRGRYLDQVHRNAILDLLVTDETNPRSIVSQLSTLADHVDALPHDQHSLLRTTEKRLTMSLVHSLRMLTAEQLSQPDATELDELLGTVDQQLEVLSDTLTRRYLVHSGTPRQITDMPRIAQ